MYCMKCGKLLPSGAIFCPYCGVKQSVTDGGGYQQNNVVNNLVSQQQVNSQPAQPSKTWKERFDGLPYWGKLMVIGGGAVALFMWPKFLVLTVTMPLVCLMLIGKTKDRFKEKNYMAAFLMLLVTLGFAFLTLFGNIAANKAAREGVDDYLYNSKKTSSYQKYNPPSQKKFYYNSQGKKVYY